MKKKYIIRLSAEQRRHLTDLIRKGKVATYRRTHAQILLFADEGELGPGLQDKEAAERAGVNHRTVSRLRQRCAERGFEAALGREPRQRERARVMCGEPPAGQSRWTLNLLSQRLVELGLVASISHETVRKVLKKHLVNHG